MSPLFYVSPPRIHVSQVEKTLAHRPTWMPLWQRDPLDEKDRRGEILASFQLVPAEEVSKVHNSNHNDKTPFMRDPWSSSLGDLSRRFIHPEQVPLNDITPPLRDTMVELSVVGLRNLLTYRNLPIECPFIEVDCGDRSAADKVRRTLPSSRPDGPNANFLETLSIPMRLPDEARRHDRAHGHSHSHHDVHDHASIMRRFYSAHRCTCASSTRDPTAPILR